MTDKVVYDWAQEQPECTGISALWCPIHGDCTCDIVTIESGCGHLFEMIPQMDDPNCPLHSPQSKHGEANAP